jgi:hypothetical protein
MMRERRTRIEMGKEKRENTRLGGLGAYEA